MRFLNKFKLFLGIFISFLIFFLMSHNTFASENFNVYWRSYQISGQSVVNQGGYNQSGTVVKLLDYVSTDTRLLKGFSADFAVSDNASYTYKTLTVVLDMWQPATSGNTFSSSVPTLLAFGSSTGLKSTTSGCSFNNGVNAQGVSNTNHAVWTCKIDWSDGGVVSNVQLVIGTIRDATSDSPNVAFTMPAGNSANSPANADVYAYSLSYTLSGSNDPSVDYLVDISSGINETNSLIQEQIENDNQNSQDIIDNQNQNTEDIIKSNQHCYTSKNLFDISKVISNPNNSLINNNNGTLTVTTSLTSPNVTAGDPRFLKSYAPTLAVGDVVTLSFTTSGTSKYIYLSGAGANFSWVSGTSKTITQAMLDAYVLWYASGPSSSATISNIQIEKGTSVTSYDPNVGEVCKNINEEYYDEQRQADENISNQSTSDINGAENQATTNLIGVLSNFFTQLQSFQATNCNLSLPFPQFIGGTQTVNICQGKDVLGNFITVIGTLAMVTFYIPLAWVLLKMIYNEIRSFTNG